MYYKSKTAATWLAASGGSFGLHRLYLHGRSDLWAWLHPWPTLLGLVGVLRMRAIGQDDHLAWLLIPLLGLMISQGMLAAIIFGLTPDAQWDARFNPHQPSRATGWGAVLGVITALLVGGGVLMGTLAFGGQMYFEFQAERGAGATAR